MASQPLIKQYEAQINSFLAAPQQDWNAIYSLMESAKRDGFLPKFYLIKKTQIKICNGICNNRFEEHHLSFIQECRNHLYCRICLESHVRAKIKSNPDVAINCSACERNPVLHNYPRFQQHEIDFLISPEEQAQLRQEYEIARNSAVCNGYASCQFLTQPIPKTSLQSFKCGCNLCLNCLAYCLGSQIAEEHAGILSNPDEKNGKYMVYSCLYKHEESKVFLKFEFVNMIFQNGPGDMLHIPSTALQFPRYFTAEQPVYFRYCQNCGQILEYENMEDTVCSACRTCFLCQGEDHPGLTCEESKGVGGQNRLKDIMQEPQAADNSPLAKIFKEVAVCMQNEQLRLKVFQPIANDQKRDYLKRTKQAYPDCKSMKLISEFITDDQSTIVALSGFSVDNLGYVSLPQNMNKPNGDKHFFVYVEVFYRGEIINKKPTENPKKGKMILYLNEGIYYCAPDYILHLAKGGVNQ